MRGRDINGAVTALPSANATFAYYDPNKDILHAVGSALDWWNTEERKQRAQTVKDKSLGTEVNASTGFTTAKHQGPTVNAATGFTTSAPGATTESSPGKMMDDLTTFAKSLGLNFGAPGANRSVQSPPAGSRSGTIPAPATSQASMIRPAGGRTPMNLPTVAGPTYSGPQVSLTRDPPGYRGEVHQGPCHQGPCHQGPRCQRCNRVRYWPDPRHDSFGQRGHRVHRPDTP